MALIRIAGGREVEFSKYASCMGNSETSYAGVLYDNGQGQQINMGTNTTAFSGSDLVTIQYGNPTASAHNITFKENCNVIYGAGTNKFVGTKNVGDTLNFPVNASGYTLFAWK